MSADCQISFGQAINNEALYVCFVLCVKVCVCVCERRLLDLITFLRPYMYAFLLSMHVCVCKVYVFICNHQVVPQVFLGNKVKVIGI